MCHPLSASRLLLPASVRMRLAPLLLLMVLAACAPTRRAALHGLPDEMRPPVRPDAAALAPAPGATQKLGCIAHERIDVWEQRLRTHHRLRDATEKGLERGEPYLPQLRQILEEAGLPPSLVLLPVVESGFRLGARDRTGSLGLWQIRPKTARSLGLVVNRQRDDRLDPERATRAAARYLKRLHAHYGDWPLALAAYNAGPGRVDRASARLPGATFWELAEAGYLPRISRDYVPRFLAVVRYVEDEAVCGTGHAADTAARSAVVSPPPPPTPFP